MSIFPPRKSQAMEWKSHPGAKLYDKVSFPGVALIAGNISVIFLSRRRLVRLLATIVIHPEAAGERSRDGRLFQVFQRYPTFFRRASGGWKRHPSQVA